MLDMGQIFENLTTVRDYNWAMQAAAFRGNRDVVERMLELGADDYDEAMRWAAGGGNREIVERMLELGSETMTSYNYDWAMRGATHDGHHDIVELLKEVKATGYPVYKWSQRHLDKQRARYAQELLEFRGFLPGGGPRLEQYM